MSVKFKYPVFPINGKAHGLKGRDRNKPCVTHKIKRKYCECNNPIKR